MLRGNARFAETVFREERAYFAELAKAQKPTVLWIGCSDSRVPVNTITQTRPGEVFVITSYSIHYTKLYETGSSSR